MNKVRSHTVWRDALRAVDRAPGESWRDRTLHHGLRAIVVLGIASLIPLLFPRAPLPDFALLEEGQIAPEDVIASFSFPVPKSLAELEAERREAAEGIPAIFVLDPAAVDTSVARAEALFERLNEAAASGVVPDTEAVRSVLSAFGVEPTAAQVSYLTSPANREALETALTRAYLQILSMGVAPISELSGPGAERILLQTPGGDRLTRRDSLLSVGAFYRRAGDLAPEGAPAAGIRLYQTLLVRFIEPTLRPDPAATQAARMQARSVVDTTGGFVLEGERIVSAHERVTSSDIERLRAYQAALIQRGMASEGTGGFLRSMGGVIYGLVLLGMLGIALLLFLPAVYHDVRGYLIIMFLLILVLVAAGLAGRSEIAATLAPVAHAALIPIAFLALLIGALYGGLLAILVVLVSAALVGGQTPFAGITVPFLMVAAGSAAAFGVREVRRRAQSWILIALITGAYLVGGLALVLMRSLPVADLLTIVFWGGVNATLCTALAMSAVLPALESVTGITTAQTLVELSDLNAPLLRELSRKAPGTYAHTVNVANLAEAACIAIGANPLLVRVGVYYHDIGKMVQPQYFVENQPPGRNPHDRLPPSRSAAIIREHVREGLRLASEHRLPETIADFIREHHGTQTIAFFLEKAKEEEPELELDPGKFAYPGPKPQSRETAIVMLADAVESATRVLRDPTPERIREVIEQITTARIREGQLDQCTLTMRDLDRVKAEFARVLSSIYHRRIEYPNGIKADGAAGAASEGAVARKAAVTRGAATG